MTTTQFLRNKFTDESITTASPSRIVIMAYDRLDRDLAGALQALDTKDPATANELLCHAQDLVTELHGMLDLDSWEHAASLAAIYQFVNELLTTANINKRSTEVVSARSLLADLGSAFKEAAMIAASVPPAAGPSVASTAFGTGTTPSVDTADRAAAPGRRVWIQA